MKYDSSNPILKGRVVLEMADGTTWEIKLTEPRSWGPEFNLDMTTRNDIELKMSFGHADVVVVSAL